MITGHRDVDKSKYMDRLEKKVHDLEKIHGDLILITGMALGVDQEFCRLGIEEGYQVYAYIPFYAQFSGWSDAQKNTYLTLLKRCTMVKVVSAESYYPNVDYFLSVLKQPDKIHPEHWLPRDIKQAYFNRNEAMVNACDECIAIISPDRKHSGTMQTYKYAKKVSKKITVISP